MTCSSDLHRKTKRSLSERTVVRVDVVVQIVSSKDGDSLGGTEGGGAHDQDAVER